MRLKKIFTSVAIASIAIAGLMVIGSIFGILKLEGAIVNLIFSAVTLCVGSIFAINATLLKDRGHKIVSMLGYALTGVSVLLFLLLIWVGGDVIFKATIVIGVSSIFANIIMSNAVRLGKKFLVVQIVEYAIVFLIDIVIVLLTFGVNVFENDTILKVFIAGCIVAGVGMIVLSILSKKHGGDIAMESKDMITIPRAEYTELKEKAKLYDEMMSSKTSDAE